MNQFLVLMKKNFIELYKTKKILILCIVFLFFAILSPISAYLLPNILESLNEVEQGIVITMPDPTYIDSYYQFISNFSQTVLFVMIIVLAPLIVDEKTKGTFHTLLNNKVSKFNFVVSKVLSQIKVVSIIYLLSVFVFLIYTFILFNQIAFSNFILFFLLIYLYYVFLICLVNFISVLVKSSIMSIGLSILAFLSLLLFNFIPVIGKYQPNYLVNIASKLIVDNEYVRYGLINSGVTIVICILLVLFSVKLCSYED